MNKIQPIRIAYQKPINLKFCAPFKNYKNTETGGPLEFWKPAFWFICKIQNKSGLSKKLKVSTLDIRIKQSGLQISYSKVPSSGRSFWNILQNSLWHFIQGVQNFYLFNEQKNNKIKHLIIKWWCKLTFFKILTFLRFALLWKIQLENKCKNNFFSGIKIWLRV